MYLFFLNIYGFLAFSIIVNFNIEGDFIIFFYDISQTAVVKKNIFLGIIINNKPISFSAIIKFNYSCCHLFKFNKLEICSSNCLLYETLFYFHEPAILMSYKNLLFQFGFLIYYSFRHQLIRNQLFLIKCQHYCCL